MSNEVFANGNEIACKSGDGKVIAAFPDVCLSPPSPPAGPVPVPYPNTSFSKDMKKGSKTVKIDGKEVMLKDKSFYKTSPLGDEAATKSLGAGVVSHVITGKTYFVAWSMDVKFEGKNVDRHIDLTTSNHASPMANESVPAINSDESTDALSSPVDENKCPCCGDRLHDNQKKDDKETRLTPIKQEQYYTKKKVAVDKKSAGYEKWAAENPSRLNEKWPLNFGSDIYGLFEGTPAQVAVEEAKRAKKMLDELNQLTTANPQCPNLHNPQDKDCGIHFDLPPKRKTEAQRKEFEDKYRDEFVKYWNRKHPDNPIPKGTPIHHMTPLDAGGCPAGGGKDKGFPGLVPDHILSGPCARIEKLQTALQGRNEKK